MLRENESLRYQGSEAFILRDMEILYTELNFCPSVCGTESKENDFVGDNTYFESDGSETGACTLRVCKVLMGKLEEKIITEFHIT